MTTAKAISSTIRPRNQGIQNDHRAGSSTGIGWRSPSIQMAPDCCQTIATANSTRNTTEAMRSPSRPARASSRGCGSCSGVHVVTGTEVPGERSSTAKTRVTQKQRCTPTEIAVPIVVPIISPTSAPEMSWASRRPAAEIGTTMTSSSFSSRHQVRKYFGPMSCSGRSM